MKNFDRLTKEEKHQVIANAHVDTNYEAMLKEILEQNEIKFQSEVILIPYRVDFIVNDMIVEVDGKYHDTKKQQKLDKKRDTYIWKKYKIDTKRITNEQVQQCYDGKLSLDELLKPDERSIKERYNILI